MCDQAGAKTTIAVSGVISAIALALIPVALHLEQFGDSFSISIGDTSLEGNALAFCLAVLAWSTAAAAQGPALTALAQELAPVGRESTALALPRAAGDATYIFAPALLGLVTDSLAIPGVECAAAGAATLIGVAAVIFL